MIFLERPLRSCLAVCLAVNLFPVAGSSVSAFSPKPSRPASVQADAVRSLEVKKPIERELKPDEVHAYAIAVSAGQYFFVNLRQSGIDVSIRVIDSVGKVVWEIDRQQGFQGEELVDWVEDKAGSCRIEIRAVEKNAAPGRYMIQLEELRDSTAKDRNLVAAERALDEGNDLMKVATRQSYSRAIEKYLEAASLFHAAEERFGEAHAKLWAGTACSLVRDHAKALDLTKRSAAVSREIGDPAGEAKALTQLGFLLDELGEKDAALAAYDQALPLSRKSGDGLAEAQLLNNLGVLHLWTGEYQKALDEHGEALKLRRKFGDKLGEAQSLGNLAIVRHALGEPEKAAELHRQSLAARKAGNDRAGQAVTLNNLGSLLTSLGNHKEALDCLTEALAMRKEQGDTFGEDSTLHNIGRVYLGQGDAAKAADYFRHALELQRANKNKLGEERTLNALAGAYDSLGESEKASNGFRRSLVLARSLKDVAGEAQTLFEIARFERKRGNLDDARSRIEEAVALIESGRLRLADPDTRSSYFASARGYYALYIEILMALHAQRPEKGFDAEALQVVERSRARSLLDLLTEARVNIRQGVDASLVERERTVQNRLAAKNRRLVGLLASDTSTEEERRAVEKELDELAEQLPAVRADIRTKSPRYVDLTRPQPPDLKTVQALLDPETALIEYSLGENQSFAWLVTSTGCRGYGLPKRADIESVAKRMYGLLSTPFEQGRRVGKASRAPKPQAGTVDSLDPEYRKTATELGDQLLGPLAACPEAKRLVIVADGILQYIPFAALPIPQVVASKVSIQPSMVNGKPQPDESGFVPLVKAFELVNLPSAGTLSVLRRELAGRKPAPHTASVMADPVFSTDDIRVAQALASAKEKPSSAPSAPLGSFTRATEDLGVSIARLSFSRREAKAIEEYAAPHAVNSYLGFDADKRIVTDPEFGQFQIVHFATHGLLNAKHPELSGIVLSMIDRNGQTRDGFLQLHEIYNLNLPAELVVLSACKTALGKDVQGEGLVGLTRGFLYSGAASVASSLWEVDDQATAELMAWFYKGILKDKLAPSAALRQAQIKMWDSRQWKSPAYWAAFQLTGEWRTAISK